MDGWVGGRAVVVVVVVVGHLMVMVLWKGCWGGE